MPQFRQKNRPNLRNSECPIISMVNEGIRVGSISIAAINDLDRIWFPRNRLLPKVEPRSQMRSWEKDMETMFHTNINV